MNAKLILLWTAVATILVPLIQMNPVQEPHVADATIDNATEDHWVYLAKHELDALLANYTEKQDEQWLPEDLHSSTGKPNEEKKP
ncbi:hypothetical protein FGIG_08227 [Fasciola gigantica]|uniref:Secreted protein n=1 Tax=Fasciola gigantica TaxID=46835 RepID=A0A504WT46_FASGI|nr:hypothetical protein FGIG_08227 [Fasciola gigantica]